MVNLSPKRKQKELAKQLNNNNNNKNKKKHASRLNLPLDSQRQQKLSQPPSQDQYFNSPRQQESNDGLGGYSGCAYRGGDTGVVCMRNMNRYTPDSNFWTSNWVSNVDVQFPAPVVQTGEGAMQALRGGGTEYEGNVCTDACACSPGNVNCACADNDVNCGWISVNHECMGAVPNGKYGSLAACESAQNYGFYGM